VEPAAGRPGHLGFAGAALVVLGALWFAVGAVLVVIAVLYGGGPGSLPPNVDVDPALFVAAPRSAAVGFGAVAVGIGQVWAGYLVTRGREAWPARAALALAIVGIAVLASWLVNGLGAGRPVLILLPAILLYLYVAWAAVAAGRAFG
jgi:hypothetical protein